MNEKFIYLNCAGERRTAAVKDIVYIRMQDHYGEVNTVTGEKYLWRKTLSDIEAELAPYGFIRCHNSYIVNIKYVSFRDRSRLRLTGGKEIPIGRKYADVARKYLRNH